ncbi:hypothetical protein VKT23_007533 [Stygiomarasmius scandens]|uniref:Late embryogenesis abundant protein LEA-2 subgroup domain-containing protein n=1 Tax=Marasmiellus scandens TaxID=2682957 RepID=A0ABR1JKR6_9AGAR
MRRNVETLGDVEVESQVSTSAFVLLQHDLSFENERQPQRKSLLQRIQHKWRGADEDRNGMRVVGDVDSTDEIPGSIREYRRQRSRGLWTKGSRLQCIGRYSCFAQLFTIYIGISIFMAIVLWLKPPSIGVSGIGLDSTREVIIDTAGITIPLSIPVSVENPNYISATLNNVDVKVSYPLHNSTDVPVGNGTLSSINIKSNSRTNFTFPFDIDISFNVSENLEVVEDLLSRCGNLSNQTDISISMNIKIKLHALGISLSPPSSSTAVGIGCPLNQTNVDDILQGLGNALGNVTHGGNPLTNIFPSTIPGLPSALPGVSFSFPTPSLSLPFPDSVFPVPTFTLA